MAIDWQKTVEKTILENIEVQKKLLEKASDPIIRAAKQIGISIRKGGKILLCGNGGSAADAQHIAAELVVRLTSQNSRPAIAAQALTVDTSILTAASNDFGFEYVFSRQIEALSSRDDTLIAISTSGNSENVIEAVNMAHEKGLYVIGLLGGNGGKLEKLVDLPVIVPSAETARIQEAHALIGHILCDLAEQDLFS